MDRSDRLAALAEARRVLRPGGWLLAEVISRHAWVLDAMLKGLLDSPGVLADLARSVETGMRQGAATMADGAFWAYFHRPDELRHEFDNAGFADVDLVAVEGYAWLLADLEALMADPESLLQTVRLTESEPSMLGCSAHVVGVAQHS